MENITKEQQWVSINDRLPDIKKKVLIYVSSDNDKLTGLHVGHRMPGDNFWIISGKFSFDVGDVTHWTTLPQLPASGSVADPKEEEESLHDQLNTEQHLVRVYKKQLECVRQQLKEREEALKELLPIAERKFNGISIDDAASHREYIALKAIIERARKLISK